MKYPGGTHRSRKKLGVYTIIVNIRINYVQARFFTGLPDAALFGIDHSCVPASRHSREPPTRHSRGSGNPEYIVLDGPGQLIDDNSLTFYPPSRV